MRSKMSIPPITVSESLNTVGTNISLEHYEYLNPLGATTNSIMIFISSIQANKIVFIEILVEVKIRNSLVYGEAPTIFHNQLPS
jgi:hypothetical protein